VASSPRGGERKSDALSLAFGGRGKKDLNNMEYENKPGRKPLERGRSNLKLSSRGLRKIDETKFIITRRQKGAFAKPHGETKSFSHKYWKKGIRTDRMNKKITPIRKKKSKGPRKGRLLGSLRVAGGVGGGGGNHVVVLRLKGTANKFLSHRQRGGGKGWLLPPR